MAASTGGNKPEPTIPLPLLGAAPENGGPPKFQQIPPTLLAGSGLSAAVVEALWEPACRIAEGLHRDEGVDRLVAFDPMTILAIVSALVSVIKFIKECRQTPDQTIAMAKADGIAGRLTRWKMRRTVRPHFDDDDMRKELEGPVVEAALKHAAAQNATQVQKVFAAVR